MREMMPYGLRGSIRLYEQGNPKNVLFEDHNIIVNTVKSLFARLMFQNPNIPSTSQFGAVYGVWGLVVGAGDPGWPLDTQPAETVGQTAIISQILRKPLTAVSFLDGNGNASPTITDTVSFQTILNATTDNINQPIREMGLIGGGSPNTTGSTLLPQSASGGTLIENWIPTNPATAKFWGDPSAPTNPDSMTLINYKTMGPLGLPAGINFILDWQLAF